MQTSRGVRRPSTGRPHGSAPPRVINPVDQISSRRSSVSSDQPLYMSYCLGLDKIGLEEEDEGYSYDSDLFDSDEEGDIYGVPDRTQSAPLCKSKTKIRIVDRAKTCFPALNFK